MKQCFNFFRRKETDDVKHKTFPTSDYIPDMMRVYAVGDIHGRIDDILFLHKMFLMDAETVPATVQKIVIYLGDYIDRGRHSSDVIELLSRHDEFLPGFSPIFLMGNHDRLFLDFINGAIDNKVWFRVGGIQTLQSYGIPCSAYDAYDADDVMRLRTELLKKLPVHHRRFLENLTLFFALGNYLFVHARAISCFWPIILPRSTPGRTTSR